MSGISLRAPQAEELEGLSALCLRSKAYWGYDDAFMAACVDELTLTRDDLDQTALQIAEADEVTMGVAQIAVSGQSADLLKLFVDPDHIGTGVGQHLFNWACDTARRMGAAELMIEADPDAEPFYRRCGARRVGQVPSVSIPGRKLPFLRLSL